jgi:hypothetical protein
MRRHVALYSGPNVGRLIRYPEGGFAFHILVPNLTSKIFETLILVKVKLSLRLLIKPYAMKTYGGVEV